MSKKNIFLISGILLITLMVAGFLLVTQTTKPTLTEDVQMDRVEEQVEPTPADSAPINLNSADPNSVDQNSPTLELVATESGQLAIDLLASNAQIETIDYGDAGEFVTNINGLAADKEHYWAFYVNEEYAEQGASQTKLVEGDIIKFVYETIWPSE